MREQSLSEFDVGESYETRNVVTRIIGDFGGVYRRRPVGGAGARSLPADNNDNATNQPGGDRYAYAYGATSYRDADVYSIAYIDLDSNDHADRHIDGDACFHVCADIYTHGYTHSRADHHTGNTYLLSYRQAGRDVILHRARLRG